MSLKLILLAGLGSFIGGSLRYILSLLFIQKPIPVFPWSTFLVNITGCLLIGLLYGFAQKNAVAGSTLLFLGTGLLGGFTTFSAFSNETITLMSSHQYGTAIVYVLSSVFIGLVLTYAGWMVAKGI